jgi:hypothetical protein
MRGIFLNLSIDLNWSQGALDALSPITHPRTLFFSQSWHRLGVFFAEAGDLVFTCSGQQPEFQEFLVRQGLPRFDVIDIPHTPGSERWRKAVREIPDQRPLDNFLFCGVSSAEDFLHRTFLGTDARFTEQDFIRWNDKRFLVKQARECGILFPKTVEDFQITSPLPDGNWLLKAVRSSGGRGILDLTQRGGQVLDFLRRFGKPETIHSSWLLQEKLEPQTHFYAVGETRSDGVTEFKSLFELKYDRSRSSWWHRGLGAHPHREAIEIATKKLGGLLARDGYQGSFGVDGFSTLDERLFPAIDLNVRVDKCVAISQASALWKIPHESLVSVRRQIGEFRPESFGSFWRELRERLDLDHSGKNKTGAYFYPYLFQHFQSSPSAVEISWFAGLEGVSAADPRVEAWTQRTYSELESFGQPLD